MFELNPGQDIPSLRQTLQGFLTSDLVHVGMTAEDNRSHYVQTIERLDMWLRQVLDGSEWIERLQTPGYWVIRDMDVNSGRPSPLIESECRRLARWLLDFDKELERIDEEDGKDRQSARLVLDTSAIVRHKSFTDVDWTKYAGAKSVRLVIPILVIRQLDDLKDSGRSDKARPRLRSIRNALAERGRGPAPIAARNTTVELLMDPPNHTRLPIADEEIIRRAQYLQGRPGGPVLLVTGDYTMQFMAEADGVPVLFLPDELRPGAASESQEASQHDGT
jgi:rRNA-processing protein FCF1